MKFFLSSVNDPGVVLDERLDMDEQIGSIWRSGFYHLRQIRDIRRSLGDVVSGADTPLGMLRMHALTSHTVHNFCTAKIGLCLFFAIHTSYGVHSLG